MRLLSSLTLMENDAPQSVIAFIFFKWIALTRAPPHKNKVIISQVTTFWSSPTHAPFIRALSIIHGRKRRKEKENSNEVKKKQNYSERVGKRCQVSV